MQPRRLALLVDAENISPAYFAQALPEVFKLGRPTIQYAYGDFTLPSAKSWVDFMRTNIIEPRQVTPFETGKNSADIALVVDAMELVLRKRCDALCIVSSDRDFAALTMFLRREGVDAYGFGKSLTDKKYRQSCAKFFELKDSERKVGGAPPPSPAPKPASPATDTAPIRTAMAELAPGLAGADGWAKVSSVGQKLRAQGLLAKSFGKRTWTKVFESMGTYQLKSDGNGQPMVRIA